ncbi:ribbon-helix-helix domain-containing protein [Bacillus cereus]|uniref:ribbon-helix-helix domain-containing protein n=1 Tax=Bacillus cereus TaxID=1396 RepID=UPI002AC03369|nr:CopG family transcriptional regulator [Bacillus cereus]MDZ4496023.1 ribbon-helix-helix domain-containing protein [Bacillus cereus]
MKKEKTMKLRISEEELKILDGIAKKTNASKSAVIRNSIPDIVTSADFNNMLTIHNLQTLEIRAKECYEFFKEGNYLPINKVKNRFPAFIYIEEKNESNDYYLNIKYPTYKVVFPYTFSYEKIHETINLNFKLSDELKSKLLFVYVDNVVLDENNTTREVKDEKVVLCLKSTLQDNWNLAKELIEYFESKSINGTIYPAYYLKSYKLKVLDDVQMVYGLIE